MQSSKILISSILVISLVTIPFLVTDINQPSISSPSTPTALNYTLSYSNQTVDFSVTSSTNAYLYISTFINGTTITHQTNQLTTQLTYSFQYPGQFYSFSARLLSVGESPASASFFIVNKTINQPFLFYIHHSVNHIDNTTSLDFTTNSQLDLSQSFINSHPDLTLMSSNASSYLYKAPVTTATNSISFMDHYNRTYADSIQVALTGTNSTNMLTNSSALQFTYSYNLINSTFLQLSTIATYSSLANVTLISGIDHYSQQSLSKRTIQSFNFTKLSYTTYQATIRVWTTNASLTKSFSIDINDTSKPIITSYSIQTGLTQIQSNFTFTKSVKSYFTLIYPNGTTYRTNTTKFLSFVVQNFIVPIGLYNLNLSVIDQHNNTNSYSFTNIRTKQLPPNSSLSLNISKRVFTIQTPFLVLYPILVINSSITTINYPLVVSLSMDGLLIQTQEVPFTTETHFNLDPADFDLQLTGQIFLNCSLPLYHLSTNTTLEYVDGLNTTIMAPTTELQTYQSNFTAGTTITLHLESNSFFSSQIFVDIFCKELNYSLSFQVVNISSNYLNADFFVNLPLTNLQYLTLEAFVYSSTTYKPFSVQIRIELTYGLDTTSPVLIDSSSIVTNNSIVQLAFNTTKPVITQIYYGTTPTVLLSYTVNSRYQSIFSVNLSSFMIQNATDYFFFTITDSSGHTTTFDNGSSYSIFIPKIDFIAPSNMTAISISSSNVLIFTASESVTVTVFCDDAGYTMNQFTCGNQQIYGSNIAITLQVPIKGTTYIVQEIIMTDKAGNKTVLSLDLLFNT